MRWNAASATQANNPLRGYSDGGGSGADGRSKNWADKM